METKHPRRAHRTHRATRVCKRNRHRWPRRILISFLFFVRTGDKTDTVDRLFDSQHVNDLRLIASAASLLLIVVAFICVLISSSLAQFLKFPAPTLPVIGAVLAWAYQRGSSRLGVVGLFACEIDTLCRMVTISDLATRLIQGDHKLVLPRHFSLAEDYFPILKGNSRDLQSLEAGVVSNITGFYSLMKAVRDDFRSAADVETHEQCKRLRDDLVYMLYLGLERAGYAMDDLVEFGPAHAERTLVILLTELTAYRFLRRQYPDEGDVHHDRLCLRGCGYVELMRDLARLMREVQPLINDRSAQDWELCCQTVPLWSKLRTLFGELQSEFSLSCSIADGRVAAAPHPISTRFQKVTPNVVLYEAGLRFKSIRQVPA